MRKWLEMSISCSDRQKGQVNTASRKTRREHTIKQRGTVRFALSKHSCSDLVPLRVKWACVCAAFVLVRSIHDVIPLAANKSSALCVAVVM